MSRNDGYITRHLLDYSYHQIYFIGIDLSRQANTGIPQQINFMEKLEEANGAKKDFYLLKVAKNYSIL